MIKQSIFIILLCCLTGNWAFAQRDSSQRGHHPKGSKLEMTEEMKTALNLTTEQRTQLDALQTETKEAIQTLKQNEESSRSAMRELHEAKQAKFAEILTDEQLVALRSLGQAQHERRRSLIEQVDREGLREEMKNYHQEQVALVVLAQRQKLEPSLSADDQASLIAIRSLLETAREERDAKKEANAENGTNKHRGSAKGKRASRHKRGPRLSTKFPEEYATLAAIVAKYDEQITSLLAEMEPQKRQWKADQAAIRAKYIPAELREGKGHPKTSREDDPQRAEKRELGSKIRFLLRDVDAERE